MASKKSNKTSSKKKSSKKSGKKSKKKTFVTVKEIKEKAKNKATPKNTPTLKLRTETDIAMDFATKAIQKFNKMIKSIVLFGSVAKNTSLTGSDIDIILILDDVKIHWDEELIAWYRTELAKILESNPYSKSLHINTVKLSTWWDDLLKGDPVVINILRYGEPLIDVAGFFEPLKYLLIEGKIKSTPEAVYNALQRAPAHIARSKVAELNAIEGIYWSMVDSAHAALIAAKLTPPSPEHIPGYLKDTFVSPGVLKDKYVKWYRDLLVLHKQIAHGEVRELKGIEIDEWRDKAEEFMEEMVKIVKQTLGK